MNAVNPNITKGLTLVLGVGLAVIVLMWLGILHSNPVQKALAFWLFGMTEIVSGYLSRKTFVFSAGVLMLILAQLMFFGVSSPSF